MMKSHYVLSLTKSRSPFRTQFRTFYEYINRMFNCPDPQRIKLVGPDRACAEWVLRNGGKVVWETGLTQADYNGLPSDDVPVPKLITIDGSDSSISHYGFPHLSGCKMLTKVILHNDTYIENRAIQGLAYGRATLKHVRVSQCPDVSDAGLKEIKKLDKLETLELKDLSSVDNLDECVQYIKSHLPKCNIKVG